MLTTSYAALDFVGTIFSLDSPPLIYRMFVIIISMFYICTEMFIEYSVSALQH
jgi:hypothetical protein